MKVTITLIFEKKKMAGGGGAEGVIRAGALLGFTIFLRL